VGYDVLYSCGTREFDDYSYRIHAQHGVVWLDVVHGQEVEVGIARLEGETLTWHRGKRVSLDAWRKAKGDVAERPRNFEISDAEGTTVLVLKRKPK
jgi:hypothetical protein